MFNSIIALIKNRLDQRNWRKRNANNKTTVISKVNPDLITIGRKTYGTINVINYSEKYKLIIGAFCSIAPEVMFVVCGDHQTSSISTFPFKVSICGEKYEASSKGNIVVEDDVWICYRSTILSGVRIGRGAIVMAGSVVTKDVEPYTIVGGVPAKPIRKRFSDEQIALLKKIDFNHLSVETIKKNIHLLYSPIQDNDTNTIEQFINALPKEERYH